MSQISEPVPLEKGVEGELRKTVRCPVGLVHLG